MTGSTGQLRTSIRMTVVAVFLIATALTAAMAVGLQYYFGQAMARQTASGLYSAAAAGIAAELDNIGNVNDNVIDLLVHNTELAKIDNRQSQLRIFIRVLEKNPLYYGIYLGHSDGSFFEVINLDNSSHTRQAHRALPSDRWLVITVQPVAGGYIRSFEYLGEDLRPRATRTEPTQYDVTSRPWYQSAMASNTITRTKPYLFAQLGIPGRTLARRIADTGIVLGLDMTMSRMSAFLRQNTIAGDSDIYLYDAAGQVIASSRNDALVNRDLPTGSLTLSKEEKDYVRTLPVLNVSNEQDWPPFDFTQGGVPSGYSVDLIRMLAAMTGIEIRFVNGYNWPDLVAQYRRGEIDLLQSVILTEQNSALGLPGRAYMTLPYALATKKDSAGNNSLPQLDGKSLAIPTGWSVMPVVKRNFPSITIIEAKSTLHALELVAAGEAEAALDSEIIMRYLARYYFLGDFDYHLDLQAGDLSFPDTLHIMVPEAKKELRVLMDRAIAAINPAQLEYLGDTWLKLERNEQVGASSTVPDESMIRIAANKNLHRRLVESRQAGEDWLLFIAPTSNSAMDAEPLYVGIRAPLATVVGPFMDKVKLSIAFTATFMLIVLPLSWIFANPIVNPIRQLAAENEKVRRRKYDEVQRIPSRVKELDELSESMVNMVGDIQAYELSQRKLMDSFIELIAQAIDDKSAYTGGHCARVPELALMLAQRASNSQLTAFQDFQLTTQDQWREYRIAAWLHDCGKITTPEHIVDKGSKLETIYNRIHEVRMRFEVLWREAELQYWQSIVEMPGEQTALRDKLAKKQRKLQDDFRFVAQCNVGGEFLGEEEQARLRDIAKTTWRRYFDNRIGLSPTENLRLSRGVQELPVTEHLLSDNPEHLIERTGCTDYPPELGIDMEAPTHLSNLGELYNLSISRGTLTSEDRYRINEHMISTIKMLESLPFPEELSKVPRYASTHHETMRGSGYPRKLSGDELSIPERILAVADIFEALTASDRPYKKAKLMSETLDIMHTMVLDNHIDRDCFELLIREKIYLQYAKQFLDPQQIDEVHAEKYLSDADI